MTKLPRQTTVTARRTLPLPGASAFFSTPPVRRRRWQALGLLIGLVAGAMLLPTETAFAQDRKTSKPQAAKPAGIDKNGVLILTRSAILALDHANRTGNYTVLRDLGTPGFQVNSAARLGDIFAGHRQQGIDLGAAAVLEPQLTLLPQIEPNGMLRMAGYFPSLPMQIDFELIFAPVEREWRLFGISVNLSKGGLAAPAGDTPQSVEKPAAPAKAPGIEVEAKTP